MKKHSFGSKLFLGLVLLVLYLPIVVVVIYSFNDNSTRDPAGLYRLDDPLVRRAAGGQGRLWPSPAAESAGGAVVGASVRSHRQSGRGGHDPQRAGVPG